MKTTFIIAFLFKSIGLISQDLTYTYPLTLPKYSTNIKTVDVYSASIENFDTSTICSTYEIKSDAVQRTILEKGQILNVINLQEDRAIKYEYDDSRNIVSKFFYTPDRDYKVDFKLNPKELILKAFSENELKELIQFDEDHRVSSITKYSEVSGGTIESKTKMIYENELLIAKEHYENNVLKITETMYYVDDFRAFNLNTKKRDSDILNVIKDEVVKKETRSSSAIWKNRVQRKIEFFDDDGNMTKMYRISENKGIHSARIEEFRFKH